MQNKIDASMNCLWSAQYRLLSIPQITPDQTTALLVSLARANVEIYKREKKTKKLGFGKVERA